MEATAGGYGSAAAPTCSGAWISLDFASLSGLG